MRSALLQQAVRTSLLLVLGTSLPSWPQIYRHVDEHGVVHFSDAPPALNDFHVIEQSELDAMTTTVPGTRLPSAADRRQDEMARQQLRAARVSAQRRLQAAEDATAARCTGYRDQLDTIQRRLRTGYGIEEGNRLRERRREIRALMARECR